MDILSLRAELKGFESEVIVPLGLISGVQIAKSCALCNLCRFPQEFCNLIGGGVWPSEFLERKDLCF